MNVIVSNLNKDKLSSLEVDIIKSISGEFEVEELIQSFSNFFFNRMFLDITAITDYENISNMQKLSIGLDVNKIIILLNDSPIVNSNTYISKLVSMGIYNFARNMDEVMYLYNNPNTYKDVAHYQQINNTSSPEENTENTVEEIVSDDVRVIGIKNITEDAGATSLVYMFKNILSKFYSIICLEVNKKDFLFYNDNNMISVSSKDISNSVLKYKNANIILIDLNDLDDTTSNNICTDILYVIEPSLIKINKLVMINRDIFSKLSKEKVILNKSFFNDKDIKDFSFEADIKIFYNIPCLDDRKDNSNELMPLFEKMNLVKKH